MNPTDGSNNPQNPNSSNQGAVPDLNSQSTSSLNPSLPPQPNQQGQYYNQPGSVTSQPSSPSQPEPIPTWPLNQTPSNSFDQGSSTGFSAPTNNFSPQPNQLPSASFGSNPLPNQPTVPSATPSMSPSQGIFQDNQAGFSAPTNNFSPQPNQLPSDNTAPSMSPSQDMESSPSFGNPPSSSNSFNQAPTNFGQNLSQPSQTPQPMEDLSPSEPGQTPSWAMTASPTSSPTDWQSISTPSTPGSAGDLNPLAFNPSIPGDNLAQTQPIPTEAAPTDLSNLVAPANNNSIASQPSAQPEFMVVPNTPTTDTTSVVSSGHPTIPGWIFILIGIIILLAVSGASAYFILGIGQPGSSISLPIIQQSPLTNLKSLPNSAIVSPTPVNQVVGRLPVATSSSQVASTSGQSAISILRQRQAGQ